MKATVGLEPDMSSEIVYFSRFLPSCDLGGGSRRMLQILETLQAFFPGMETVSSARLDRIPADERERFVQKSGQTKYRAPGFPRLLLGRWPESQRDMVFRLRKISTLWQRSISGLDRLRLVCMDDPVYFRPLARRLLAQSVPLLAVCHNIETLSSGQALSRRGLALLADEIDLLQKCSLVITISREEDVFLRNLGVACRYYPYYPVAAIERQLLEIRRKRMETTKQGILLLGNMYNLPTRCGMERIAAFWQKKKLYERFGRLLVAGLGSEIHFHPGLYGEAVVFLGTLSADQYGKVLSEVLAVLCYQETGAGALTRICEMQVAGIPVLANSHAARSYYRQPGVYEFTGLDTLTGLLEGFSPESPQLPPPQPPENADLSAALFQIVRL